MEIKGKTAVVTGASSGIGQDFARQLAERGANLILVARRKERLDQLADELRNKFKVDVKTLSKDLTLDSAAKEVFEESTKDGQNVHILVNNAGCGFYGGFTEYELDQHQKTIRLNVMALTDLTHLFSKHMLEHKERSHIVNVASIGAFMAVPNFAVYTGTKSYVKYLSEALDFELKGSNVNVTCLCPGGTYTEFMEHSNQELTKYGHKSMMSSSAVAKIGIDAMINRRRSVVTGMMNKVATFLPRIFPSSFAMGVTHKIFSRAVKVKNAR